MSQETQNNEVQDLTTCQKCGANDPNLSPLDSGLKLALSQAGEPDIPGRVCNSCLKELKKSATHGAQLKANEEAKQKNRTQVWAKRLDLVKAGRSCLQRQEYAEAAMAYEKYIKVVSLVVEKSRSELEPKFFNDHPKEITIIASVLWDLMLIYDSHIKFASQQTETADVLARFLRFSPVYNSIIRKAEIEARRAKNPAAYKHLLKLCDVQASRCFIANSAFGTRTDVNVVILCNFRDQVLKRNRLGRSFVAFYYRHGPVIAAGLDCHPRLKRPVRLALRGAATALKRIFDLPESRVS